MPEILPCPLCGNEYESYVSASGETYGGCAEAGCGLHEATLSPEDWNRLASARKLLEECRNKLLVMHAHSSPRAQLDIAFAVLEQLNTFLGQPKA